MKCVFNHVHIFTNDPEATAEWFARHLNGKAIRYKQSDGRPRIDIQFGEVFFYVSRPSSRGTEGDAPADGPVGIHHVGFSVEDVDVTVERLRNAGVAIIQPPRTARPGVRNAYVSGPEGIIVEIFKRDSIDYALLEGDATDRS